MHCLQMSRMQTRHNLLRENREFTRHFNAATIISTVSRKWKTLFVFHCSSDLSRAVYRLVEKVLTFSDFYRSSAIGLVSGNKMFLAKQLNLSSCRLPKTTDFYVVHITLTICIWSTWKCSFVLLIPNNVC